MKSLFFKKIILAVTIVSFISGSLGNVFTPKVLAQGPATPGEAVGQALAKGAACFLAARLESFAAGLGFRQTLGRVEDLANALNPLPVPVSIVAGGAAATAVSVETSNALMESKKCIRDVVVKMILDWIVDETIGWIQEEGKPRYVTNWETFLEDAFNVGVGEIISETNLAWLCKPFGLQVRMSLLPVPRFKSRIECTLDDIIANIEDFYNDFRNGSWIAYEASWQPQNNYYGALYMTMDEAMAKGAQQKEAAEKKAVTGQGFLPVERCIRTGRTDPNDPKTEKCLEYEIITPAPVVGHLTTRAAAADLDWAMSVQSWMVALTNAVINRVIKEGIGLMKKSTAPKSAGYGDYDPYAGYDPALSLKRQERDRIRGEYQNYLAYFEAILTNKKSSLSSVEQLVVTLTELKKRNCQPPVSDADITAAQNEVTRLTGEVASYQTIVNEINANITEANNISENFRDREMALLTQKYNDFLIKYQSYISEISSGSETTKKSAQQESQTKQNELSSAQSRLTLCIATQSP
jgi:hypothetical protein